MAKLSRLVDVVCACHVGVHDGVGLTVATGGRRRALTPCDRQTGVSVKEFRHQIDPGRQPGANPVQIGWLSAERDGAENAQPVLGIGSCRSSDTNSHEPAGSHAATRFRGVLG